MKRRIILSIFILLATLCFAASVQAEELCKCGSVMELNISADSTSCSLQCINPECENYGTVKTYDHTTICIGRTCAHCGMPGMRQHPQWVADVSKSYLRSAATCNREAIYYKICRVCGAPSNSDDEVFTVGNAYDPNNHGSNEMTVEIAAREPDCGGGNYALKKCSGCEKYVCTENGTTYDTIPDNWADGEGKCDPIRDKHPQPGHSDVIYPGNTVTCLPGSTPLFLCSTCHKYFRQDPVVTYDSLPADYTTWANDLGRLEPNDSRHLHSEMIDAVPATCSTAGNIQYWICKRCGKNIIDTGSGTRSLAENEEVLPAKHSDRVEFKASVSGTCTTKAVGEHWYCSECGKYFLDSECKVETTLENLTGEKDPANHDYTKCDPVPAALYSAATCTAPAYYHKSCSRCGAICQSTDVNYLFASGDKDPDAHYGTQTDALAAKEPTCIESGWYAATQCNACSAWYNTEQGLYLENGTESGWKAYAQTISEDAHDPVNHPAKAPTCTKIGWDAYQTCKRDGCNWTTYAEKPALGHNYVKHAAQAPTCTEIGWNAYCTCRRCDYSEYVEKPAAGHDWSSKDGFCTVCGMPCSGSDAHGTETCPVCGYCEQTGQTMIIIADGSEAETSLPVSVIRLTVTPSEPESAGIFTDAELRSLNEGNSVKVYITVTEVPDGEEQTAFTVSEALGTLTLDIRLIKQIGNQSPEEVTECKPLQIKVKLQPEAIPEGTEKVLALLPGAAEPAECEYDAETGEISYVTGTFGIMTFVFL